MRLMTLPLLLSAALLSVATAATAATPASVAVNATVEDACEIILGLGPSQNIEFDYQAAATISTTGTGAVLVRCNLDSGPFLAYWDDTQWNPNGSVDLMNGTNKLNVVLSADADPTFLGSDSIMGSGYVYNLMATAAAGQWTAPTGSYTKVVDFYVGW